MPRKDIIVIGASAGGVDALIRLVSELPQDLPAAVFVVVHISPTTTSVLPKILSRRGPLPAVHPRDGEAIALGNIYVAPPNSHLTVEHGIVRLSTKASENGHRPAVDPLFRSAARHYGQRVLGVILSGTLDDGTAGAVAINRCGGMVIVQDPNEAAFAGMPNSAIAGDDVAMVLPVSEIARVIAESANMASTGMSFDEEREACSISEIEMIDSVDRVVSRTEEEPGASPSIYTCPACSGTLLQTKESTLHFRCRVGHAFSVDSLLAGQAEAIEAALWTALRSLEENASLAQRLATRAQGQGRVRSAAQFAEHVAAIDQHSSVLRELLTTGMLHLAPRALDEQPAGDLGHLPVSRLKKPSQKIG